MIRYRQDGGGSVRTVQGALTEIPRWLRLERLGELIVALDSPDGNKWEEVGRQTIPGLPENVLCGIGAWGVDSIDAAKPFTPVRARLSGLVIVPVDAAFLRGDANEDGKVDLSDAVYTLGHLFLGSAAPGCLDAADADDSGTLEITDAIYGLGYLFLGSPAPPEPFPGCNPDPTGDDLGCDGFAACP
jgi:hypothetical protein